MLSPATSSVMVGRSQELDGLRAALQASMTGSPRGVLVMGEAGIGKTRLIRDFVASLGDDAVVAVGYCVPGRAVPVALQPIRALIRELIERFDGDDLHQATNTNARLLPAALTGLVGAPDAITGEQLEEAIPALLEGLSSIAPITLIVEDLHWADVSTIDLLRSLLRSLRHGRLLIVVTHRSGEVGPEHPSQPLILELERARDVTRVTLQRLSSEETAVQARAIRGSDLDPDSAAALFTRSEGVPFYVEELLAANQSGALPDTLRELLLARYWTLSPQSQAAVRLVAAGGVRVDHRILARVHDGSSESFDGALREAMAAHVLRVERDTYRFRHALVHEAVLDELLPGEGRRFHAAYAKALEAEPRIGARYADAAHHWRAAGDDGRAMPALVAAMREARAAGAPRASAELGQQALDLWFSVEDPELLAGCPRSQLLLEVGSAYDAASDPRAMPFLERAVEEVPASDALGRALLLCEAMLVRDEEGQQHALALGRRALALLPDGMDDEARFVRARVQTRVGIVELLHGEPSAHARLQSSVAEARALVAGASDPAVAGHAHAELAMGLTYLGVTTALGGAAEIGQAALAEGILHARADVGVRLRAYIASGWLLHQLGEHRAVLVVTEEGRGIAVDHGMARGTGTALTLLGSWSQIALGNLAEATAVVRGVRGATPVRTAIAYCAGIDAELLVLQDAADAAAEVLRSARSPIGELRSDGKADDLNFARLDAEIALARGDPETAWMALAALWRWPDLQPGPSFALIDVGARALMHLEDASIDQAGISVAVEERRLRRAFDEIAVWDVANDWRALLEAELSRGDSEAWQAACTAAARGRVPVRLRARASRRLAAAHLHAGDRDSAAGAVDAAADIAQRHGLLRETNLCEQLAMRARLGSRRQHPQDGSSLTDRERQVLALVAQGLSNRQIGERLYISGKTASVHVSAILRKLGAATRAEAAARAASILI